MINDLSGRTRHLLSGGGADARYPITLNPNSIERFAGESGCDHNGRKHEKREGTDFRQNFRHAT
jgi:hypothetical protein